MLGIGVDDMFVIVGALKNLTDEQQKLPLNERIGKALRHSGASITVTSLTDIMAFFIGATTVSLTSKGVGKSRFGPENLGYWYFIYINQHLQSIFICI